MTIESEYAAHESGHVRAGMRRPRITDLALSGSPVSQLLLEQPDHLRSTKRVLYCALTVALGRVRSSAMGKLSDRSKVSPVLGVRRWSQFDSPESARSQDDRLWQRLKVSWYSSQLGCDLPQGSFEGRTHESCSILTVLAVDRHPPSTQRASLPSLTIRVLLLGLPWSVCEEGLDERGLSEVAAEAEDRRASDRRLRNVERVECRRR